MSETVIEKVEQGLTNYNEARAKIVELFQTTIYRYPTNSDIEAMTGLTLAEAEARGIPPQQIVDMIGGRLELRLRTAQVVGNRYTTLVGIPISDITHALDARLPADAYDPIKFGVMQGKTDVDPRAVRDRFDAVFGACGIGWSFAAETNGGIKTYTEERKNSKGDVQTWQVCVLENYTFRYAIVDQHTNEITWNPGITVCDMSDNLGEMSYAIRGAISAALKQVYARLGGMNHIYTGRYTHIQAQRDLAKKAG